MKSLHENRYQQDRKRTRKQLRCKAERERVGFTDGELRQMVAEIKAESGGEACGGCRFGLFGDQVGMCSRWAISIFNRGAIGCRQWEKK